MQRPTLAAIAIGGVIALAAVSFAAGSRIASPAEVAARTAPPVPSLILVPVEQRVLTTKIVARGTGKFGSPQKLSVAASALKAAPGLIATTALPGAVLGEGDVVASASGRPILLLVGAAPMGRDLGPGSVGEDVHQLEAALARLGFDPGSLDTIYDGGTAEAVAAWYAAKGYAPFTATADLAAAARARQAELDTVAIDAAAAADAVPAAQANLDAARAALATAENRASTTAHAVNRARDEAAAANAVAAADVAAKQSALDALGVGGQATPAELSTAQSDLRVAKANAETVRLAGERAQDEAGVAATDATVGVPSAQSAVRSAEAALATAAHVAGLRAGAVERAALERDLARGRTGVQVPADELVFVAAAPIRVAESLVGVGDPATGGIAKVTDATIHVEAGLALADAKLVKAGMAVEIAEPDLGIAVNGAVSLVATGPGTNGVDGFHVYVEIAVTAPPPNLAGASVRLTIPVDSTGSAALAVPVSALTLGPDGTSRVRRATDNGIEVVSVQPGLSADGYVAVTAAAGALAAGDQVVIGTDTPTTTAAAPPDAPTATTAGASRG